MSDLRWHVLGVRRPIYVIMAGLLDTVLKSRFKTAPPTQGVSLSANPPGEQSTTGAVLSAIGGGALLAVAAIVALVPVRTSQLNYPNCGSALAPSVGQFGSANEFFNVFDRSYFSALCSDALAPMRTWSIVLAILGLALLSFGLVRISLSRSKHIVVTSPVTPASLSSELQRLGDLRARKLLTDEEFERA
ncbi:MAG TPA: SHOCT domain-containing protein, partial [Coriobacteriia bacterium]|nr:SHOCT domain-containing protein [Coriobacteriia bacterium]